MAHPDPAIHTQSRFGRLLGHDGTFVSHVEAGRRMIPPDLRDRWFQLIGLGIAGLQDYLITVDPRPRPPLWSALPEQAPAQADFDLVDQALEGESLTPTNGREHVPPCQRYNYPGPSVGSVDELLT